jgi:hypothetical protein
MHMRNESRIAEPWSDSGWDIRQDRVTCFHHIYCCRVCCALLQGWTVFGLCGACLMRWRMACAYV